MRIHNHCFLFILLLSLVFPIILKADGVKGRVVDEETGMPIADANIQLVVKIYNGQTTSVTSTDSLGLFCLSSYFTGRAVISISFLGYKTETVSEYLFSDNESSDTIDLGDIKLKRSATMLKALEVTGHLPKVTMSGDTIVFNPEAIKLEDNAKILQLLRKLPGVRQHKDGRFYWNDKPIRLMMNGKDTFGEALVTQLPADIVKKLKLYDRRSKLARHTGVSDGKEDNVLDIQIKPGFMDKFYGTAQAQYLTTDHYYAHTNGIKLSNASPMMFLLNANNINESCKMNYNSLTTSTSTDYGKGIFGGLSLSHNWQTEGADDSNRISFSPFLGHHDEWSDIYSSTQNYFPGEQQTFTLSKTHSYKHELSPSFDLATDLYTDSVNELSLLGSFSYTKTHSKIENIMARYDTEPYAFGSFPIDETFNAQPGTGLFSHTLLRSRNKNMTNNDQATAKLTAQWTHFLPQKKGEFHLSANSQLTSSNARQLAFRSYDYLQRQPSIGVNQWGRNPKIASDNSVQAEIEYIFNHHLTLRMSETVGYDFMRDNIDFYADSLSDTPADYRATTADPANRLRSHQNTLYNTVKAEMVYNFTNKNHLTPSISWSWYHDHLNYHRGNLDTTATRCANLIAPSLKWLYKIDRTQNINAELSYVNSRPDLSSTIDYTDSRNPLNISRGNRNLRNSGRYAAKVNYSKILPRQQILLNTIVDFSHETSPLTYLLVYNSQTGGYTTMPVNVKGGNNLKVTVNYNQSLGAYINLQNEVSANWRRDYAYLTATDFDQPLIRNTQRAFVFKDNLNIAYETDNFHTSVFARLEANNYHYSETTNFNSSPLDLTYGTKLWMKMGKFKLSTDILDEFHCGYLSDNINRHRCIWNASASLAVMKGIGTVTLGMNDILNQQNQHYSSVSAYQRFESWNTLYTHYAYLKFEYNFRPKKRK